MLANCLSCTLCIFAGAESVDAAMHLVIAKITVLFCAVLAVSVFLEQLKRRKRNERQKRRQFQDRRNPSAAGPGSKNARGK